MKTTLYLIIVIMIGHISGRDTNLKREVLKKQVRPYTSTFNNIEIDGSNIFVLINENKNKNIELSAKEKYLKYIETNIKDSTLSIWFNYKKDPQWKGVVNNNDVVKIYVPYQLLKALHIKNGAKLVTTRDIRQSNLDIDISSGGTLKSNVICDNLNVRIRSGAKVQMKGRTINLRVNANGKGYFDGEQLLVGNCLASSSGDSKLILNIKDTLTASAKNFGKIYYKDNLVKLIQSKERDASILGIN